MLLESRQGTDIECGLSARKLKWNKFDQNIEPRNGSDDKRTLKGVT